MAKGIHDAIATWFVRQQSNDEMPLRLKVKSGHTVLEVRHTGAFRRCLPSHHFFGSRPANSEDIFTSFSSVPSQPFCTLQRRKTSIQSNPKNTTVDSTLSFVLCGWWRMHLESCWLRWWKKIDDNTNHDSVVGTTMVDREEGGLSSSKDLYSFS